MVSKPTDRSAAASVSDDITDYYLTPWDVDYGRLVKFDHDFIGRAALEKMVDRPHRRKVTLEWNAEDVLAVERSIPTGQEPGKYGNALRPLCRPSL
jgi:vanillate/3-O-methylgallate O-demethylase